MGILIDIILIAIVVLSAFLGYKKGLVKLGAKLFAGIIAIIITIVIYKPVSGIIINNTSIDEKIEAAIVQNTTNFIENNTSSNIVTNNIENNILPDQAKEIARSVVYAITAVVLFIVVKIVLSIIISLMDSVANLPILKQFNEVGRNYIWIIKRGINCLCMCFINRSICKSKTRK